MLRTMAVPRMAQLGRGVGVNIVLKKDQPTGKLTSGQVADILTRGDHPRGIKVRLTNGQIGRVQSLATEFGPSSVPPVPQPNGTNSGQRPHSPQRTQNDMHAAQSTSLSDYIVLPKQKKSRTISPLPETESITTQQQMEAEFPMLDSALIAAILADHGTDMVAARDTLSLLATG